MSNAAENAVTNDDDSITNDEEVIKSTESSEKTFFESVNEVVGKMTQKEDGTWELPEGDYSPELKYAAVSEKRYRDAQSALGKTKHQLNTTSAEIEALKNRLKSKAVPQLTAEQREELEELKYADPDAWRVRINELESSATTEVDSELAEVSKEVTQQSEIARREEVLAQFISENPGFQLNDDIINNDIPPRMTKKLDDGKVSFEDWLVEVKDYLSRGKVVHSESTLNQPNLSRVGGSDKADPNAVDKDIIGSYANELY